MSIGFTQGMKITGGIKPELVQEIIPGDTNTVNELTQKAEFYYFSKPDSSLYFAQQALDLARKLNFTKQEIALLNACGECYRFVGDYPNALDCQFQALQLSRSFKDYQHETVSLGFIGLNYSDLGEYRQALPYLFAAKAIREQHPNAIAEAFNLSNIGNTYAGLGLFDSALFFLEKAWEKAQTTTHPNLKILTLQRIGNVKVELEQYDEALAIYHDALNRARKANDKVNPGNIRLRITELHLKLHQKDSALSYARLAFADAWNSSQRQLILGSANHIAKILRERSAPDSVVYYQDIVLAMKDSLFGPTKVRQLQVLALREQQRKLDVVREQNEFRNKSRLFGLSGVLIFVLAIAFILYKNFRQKHKVNLVLETQKKNLETTLIDLKATQLVLLTKFKTH
jgi:tetratricopeptide (TPR) repeat protein